MKELLEKLVVYEKTIPAKEGVYAAFPEDMHEGLVRYLDSQKITSLYQHQAEMFRRVRNKEQVVITTSTASGKTLAFLLPIMQEILEHPNTRAIFLYPTKALAADQYRAMESLIVYFGKAKVSIGVYDGDTTVEERRRIRKEANIILTNPEMLNGAFLPNHNKYGFDMIFANLKYVVVDELHTYRGVFGSHVANVFRRLDRVCEYYDAKVQFLCSSATIANPKELAEEVCGGSFGLIDEDGAPRGERTYKFLQPPKIENQKKQFEGLHQAKDVAAELLPDLVEEKHTFIAFAKSRRTVEVVLRETKDKLDGRSLLGTSLADQVAGYRGGYTPMERKKIEQAMMEHSLRGLVSTNALELGIDIGAVDTTVLVGYPGKRASFWQQTGRAGRNGTSCCNYMVLESSPQDQYIAINPDFLFANAAETAILDKDNLLIELAHIRAAAAELPLTLDDTFRFPDLGEAIPVLLRIGELREQRGKYVWAGNAFPAGDFSMRNMDDVRYKLIHKETKKEITEMDELQAFREIHDGAIYLHGSTQYLVTELDLESRTAYAIDYESDYYTLPAGQTELKVLKKYEEKSLGRTRACWGDVNVNDQIFMYKKLQFHNHQNLGYEKLRQPLTKAYDTEGLWISVPEDVVKTYRSYLQPDRYGRMVRNNHFDGMCHALQVAAQMLTMTEREDIGVSVSTSLLGEMDAVYGDAYIYLYDKFVGGLGYAEKAFDCLDEILDRAIALVEGCHCKDGCAVCVGDYKLQKDMVRWGLVSLRESLTPPQYQEKTIAHVGRSVEQKPFLFMELPEKWSEFAAFLVEKGERYGKFLSTMSHVALRDNTLVLYTKQAFYQTWMQQEENKQALYQLFYYYTEAPEYFQIQMEVELAARRGSDLETKLRRKYGNHEDEEWN